MGIRTRLLRATRQEPRHAGLSFQGGCLKALWAVRAVGGAKLRECAVRYSTVSQTRENSVDVLREGIVGADYQHILCAKTGFVKQEPRHSVEYDCCFACARPALDDEQLVKRQSDQIVLRVVDGADDVL